MTTQTTCTKWTDCKNGPWYPTLPHGGYVAYRIWFETDGRSYFQRHEWKRADGTIEMDGWIPSFASAAMNARAA